MRVVALPFSVPLPTAPRKVLLNQFASALAAAELGRPGRLRELLALAEALGQRKSDPGAETEANTSGVVGSGSNSSGSSSGGSHQPDAQGSGDPDLATVAPSQAPTPPPTPSLHSSLHPSGPELSSSAVVPAAGETAAATSQDPLEEAFVRAEAALAAAASPSSRVGTEAALAASRAEVGAAEASLRAEALAHRDGRRIAEALACFKRVKRAEALAADLDRAHDLAARGGSGPAMV